MKSFPLLLRNPESITSQIAQWRLEGRSIGFVPTMGALHEGHATLVEEARKSCGKVVVSIFVNPAQFAPNEDYARYPRTVDKDVDLLSRHGCDLVWLPDVQHIYPEGFATKVSISDSFTSVLCGAHRKGHFDGVATVISVLLNVVRPDASFFGEKDYQQLQIIRRLGADLRLPGTIHGVPTVRERDGLALSSRNQYLSEQQRRIAPQLYATLKWVRDEAEKRAVAGVLEEAKARLIQAGFDRVDYLEIRHGETLELLPDIIYPLPDPPPNLHSLRPKADRSCKKGGGDQTGVGVRGKPPLPLGRGLGRGSGERYENLSGGRVFVAAWLGKTRLIDNLVIARSSLHERSAYYGSGCA